MEHASALLEQVPRPAANRAAPGFWRDFLLGMLKPAAATAVVAMAVALSFAQRLRLEREMLYATGRVFLQLSVVGFVLHFIFAQRNALWILLAYLFMVTVAGYTAGQRAKQVPGGKYIAWVSILVSTAIAMLVLVVLRVFPFTPKYIVPIAGMMVGNAMAATGVTMKKLREDVEIQRNMVTVAGYTAGQRAKRVPGGKYIACVSILAGTAITMLVLVVLKVFPFIPRYIVPVAGMLVGCAMTVTGVTVKKLREEVKVQRSLVETALALDATPREAMLLQQVKRSLGIALSPVIDNAKTVGLIALPGAMTGLIMGGASQLEAIQLQIVVKNMVMAATTVSSIVSYYLCWAGFFTKAFQLKDEVFDDE